MSWCKKCGSGLKVEDHHVHCKFLDNPKGLGIKIYFCKKCHTILHLIIPSIIWKYIREEDKPKIIEEIKQFTIKYSQEKPEETKNSQKDIYDFENPKWCGNPGCIYELDEEDYIDNICPYCSESIKNGDTNGYKHN